MKEIKNGNGKRKMLAPYRPKEVECGNVTLETLVLPHANWPDILAYLISKAHPADASRRNLGGAVGSHGIGTWRQGTVELHTSGVCPALHRGRSSDETSNGEAVAGALGWEMTRVTMTIWVSLEDCKRFGKPSSKMHNLKAAMIRYCIYIYIYLFISLASRVYSVNSLFCLACIRC